MLTILYLILILGLLIFVHELGHFIAAKLIGVYVYEFALGMGPKIFSFKRKKHHDPTLYSLRLFPIGGFCAMAGETTEEEDKTLKLKKNQFMCNRSKWERFLILIAGVTNNIILAFILLFVQSLIWGNTEQKSIIGYIAPDKPVAKAGIEVGDTIKEVNGYKVNTWDKLTIVLNLKNKSNKYVFVVKKSNGDIKKYTIVPEVIKNKDKTTTKVFGLGSGTKVYKGLGNALKYAFMKVGSIVSSMWIILYSLFTGKLGLSSLSGPVGMYSVVGQTVNMAFKM
jgi:regulator of sigma E protease